MMLCTQGIILRNIKYGETSVIITIFTKVKGKVQFIVKGIRQARKKTNPNLYTVGQLVELSFIYHEHKTIHYITDINTIDPLGMNVDIVRHCIYIFCIEVCNQITYEQQVFPALFNSIVDARSLLLSPNIDLPTANYPLFFLLALTDLCGYSILNNYDEVHPYFDIYEGRFSNHLDRPQVIYSLDIYKMLHVMIHNLEYSSISGIHLHQKDRRSLIELLIKFFEIHIPNFKPLKSLPVLIELLE